MVNIKACRICLSTNIKLFNMCDNLLISAYEVLTGLQISPADGLPQYTCSYCSIMLQKSVMFKDKCQRSHQVLKCLAKQRQITTERIQSLDLSSYQLSSVYAKTVTETVDYSGVKEEINYSDIDYAGEVEIAYEEESQEKCVSIKVEDDANEEENGIENIYMNATYGDDVDVIFLSKEQQIEEIQSRKKSMNYLKSYYKCDKCYKGFMIESTYKNHMARHDPSRGLYECEICRTRWSNLRTVRAHCRQAHQVQYLCKLCDYISKSGNKAKEHSNWHKGHSYVCKICGATFSKSTSHLTHVRLQHPSDYTCNVCGESFIGEIGLRMHHKKSHRDTEQDSHCCPLCGVQFQTLEALARHADVIENGICDPNLRPCGVCGTNFENEELLKSHLKVHSKEDHAKCDECNRDFANERSYALHYQRVHLGIKGKPSSSKSFNSPVVCEVCGKECISKSTLVYHQRIHTGEKPYHCTECPKKFSVQQRLQIHLRTHTGERPYQCTLCPKAFKHKAALNRHDRVHTGAKPYTCQHCGKSFSQSNSMKVHIKTVHQKMPAPYRSRRKI
ncbi:uncharacterized protein ACR2FA_010363 [Aphomia sociella]